MKKYLTPLIEVERYQVECFMQETSYNLGDGNMQIIDGNPGDDNDPYGDEGSKFGLWDDFE